MDVKGPPEHQHLRPAHLPLDRDGKERSPLPETQLYPRISSSTDLSNEQCHEGNSGRGAPHQQRYVRRRGRRPQLRRCHVGHTMTKQQPIEIILLRRWASHMAMPVWIAGEEGELLYYNEPAEELLGQRFDEAGEMPLKDLPAIFR